MTKQQSSSDEQQPRPDDPAVLREPPPVYRSIPWVPVSAGAADPAAVPYALFVSQRALLALQEADAVIEFLVGHVGACPDTGSRYVVIRSAVRLAQPVLGDRPLPVIARAWKRLAESLPKDGTQVLGWHRTQGVHGTLLTLADREMHRQFFTQPWHVALVTAFREGQPAGSFYRPQSEGGGQDAALPFFELCEEAPVGQAPQSCLTWVGYRSTDPRIAPPSPRRSGPTAGLTVPRELVRHSGSQVLLPVYDHDPDDPAWANPPRRWPRLPRAMPYVVMAALGAGAVLGLNLLRTPKQDLPAPVFLTPVATPAEDSLTRAVAALDLAVRAYGEKQALFDSRMMVCADLSGALVEVEERFLEFSILLGAGAGASGAASSRHDLLAASVDSVDRHFERSRCRRP